MKLLLDTHAFLWWDQAPERLSGRALRAITRASNEVLLSVVSLWEIVVKVEAGKLRLDVPLRSSIDSHRDRNALGILPLQPAHVWALQGLPGTHGDPFDRLLAAQASCEGLVLVTRDERMRDLKVRTLW